ncbi:MAG: caspase family protein [Proteobacteria bacterium]|nr:caspase family protein [Pseudomonadota bacterium]MBU1687895.1 caspase family protein [Pseudomonadota bacterium]
MPPFNRPIVTLLTIILLLATFPGISSAGNRKLMSINAAKVLATRALAETVQGLTVVSDESVTDLAAGLPEITVAAGTEANLKGIRYEEISYDQDRDIAKVTASLIMDSVKSASGEIIPMGGQKISRVAFATTTPDSAGPLEALRAAELDAYRKLGQEVAGLTLESRTVIGHRTMQSDSVKSRTRALLYLAQVIDYSWDSDGNAHVRMAMDLKSASVLLGEKVMAEETVVEVEGEASQMDEIIATAPSPGPQALPLSPAPQTLPPTIVRDQPSSLRIRSGMSSAIKSPTPFSLPGTTTQNSAGIAVIIGNRDYAKVGKEVPNIDYALRDAEAITTYVTRTLGFREGNIIRLNNATQADLVATFGSESNPHGKLMDWVKPGESEVFIYYSGHGAPSLTSGKGYLLPVDADPAKVDLNGYALDLLYSNLDKVRAKTMTVVIDACFSGTSAGGALVKNASSLSLRTVASKAPASTTILTAAATTEVASWDTELGHGLFTRYFLEGISGKADQGSFGNNDHRVTLAELSHYLQEEVAYNARKLYGREQHPQINGDDGKVLSNLSE